MAALKSPVRATIFEAGWLVAPEGVLAGAALRVENGIVREVVRSRARVRRLAAGGARRIDLGEGLLAPAFVDAHAHLELSGLAGALPRARSFTAWIRALLAARAQETAGQRVAHARRGALRLLETGTTLVGDVDATGAIEKAGSGLPLRIRRYREVLDANDSSRTAAALARLERSPQRRPRFFEGVSPHAPYTVGPDLWRALGAVCRARRAHVMIHFAETREETEWLEHGRGPMASILRASPRTGGLDAIEAAGLLGPRTALVHGNRATESERARIARSGATLVHCPGTHAFFRRAPFPARAWIDAGVTLALGTDSLASNADLDMGRELALFAAAQPDIAPAQAFACATRHGARALGFTGRAGELVPAAWADFLLFHTGSARGAAALELAVRGKAHLAGTWSGGRPVAAGSPGAEKARPVSETDRRAARMERRPAR